MQLEASSCPKYNPLVQEIQRKLNSIKYRVHGTWPSLNTDGKFGGMTKQAVIQFQIYKNITPVSGIVGDTTFKYINEEYNYCPILHAVSQTTTKIHSNNDFGKMFFDYFYKPMSNMVVDFLLDLQKDYSGGTKDIARRLASNWNSIINKIRTKLLLLVSTFKANKIRAYEQLKKYWNQKEKLASNRKGKSQRYDKNIENVLNKHLGPSRFKIDANTVYKQLKVGKVISGAGKLSAQLDLIVALGKVVDDINNINDSQAWASKWAKDISGLTDVLIGMIIAAIVVLLLPEEMAGVLVCLIVGAVGLLVNWLLELFHNTYIGQSIEKELGVETTKFVNTWQNEMNAIKLENKMAEEAWIKSQGTITIKLF